MNFDRNYIRNKIIPIVKERWQGLNKVMKHNISLQDTYKKISIDYCDSIYDHVVDENKININILKSYPKYLYTIFLKYFVSQTMNYELNKNELSKHLSLLLIIIMIIPSVYSKIKHHLLGIIIFYILISEKTEHKTIDKVWDLKR